MQTDDLVRALFSVPLLLVLGSCSLLTDTEYDWPTWRYDASRSAASPQHLPDQLHLLWVREYPRLEQTWDDPLNQDLMQFDRVYEPVVHDGTLFVASNASDCMIALATETGLERWRYYTDGPVRFPAATWNGRVYFTSDDGHLYCLDAGSGSLIWKFRGVPEDRDILGNERLISTWPARGGPVLQDGIVYFAAGIWPFMGVFIFAVDAQTGELIWQNDSAGRRYMLQPHNSPAYAGVAPQGHLVIAGNRLLVPCGRSVPACFDLETGRFLYYRLAENGKTGGAFVAAQGDFFVNYHRDSVVSLYRLEDGEAVLRRLGKMPVLTDDTFYCRGQSIAALDFGHLKQGTTQERVVFDRESGSIKTIEETEWILDQLWQLEVDASGDLIKAGDRLYGAGQGHVFAVSLPGWLQEPEIVWSSKIEGTAGRIIAADGKLFVVTVEGRIYAFGNTSVDSPPFHSISSKRAPLDENVLTRADAILHSTGVRDGYCLVYGGNDADLIEALLLRSELRIIVVESDHKRAEELRRRFDAAGYHGKRLSIKPSAGHNFKPPAYFASLAVIADLGLLANGKDQSAFFESLYQGLRPYGGTAYIPIDGDAALELQEQLFGMELENAQVRRIAHDKDLLDGVRHAQTQFQPGDLSGDLASEIGRVSELLQSEGHLLLIRSGALPGSGDWTHQYGNIANTVMSDDRRVRLPLGILWFGGNSNMDVLPRHGHGPPEQVVGGRLFIEGVHSLSARDVYTGRVLWKREFSRLNTDGVYYDETYRDAPLDTAYNQVHIPGANARGTNFVATEDRVYLLLDRSCVVLDPNTGRTIDEFRLPAEDPAGLPPEWAYIGVYGDYLIGGAEFADYLDYLDLDELDSRMKTQLNSFYNFDITASKRLVVMNRYTGEVLWTRASKLGFWHNAITVADNTIFCIDRLAPSVTEALKRRPGKYRFGPTELLAFRIEDGILRWRDSRNVFGTWLSCSEENGLLIQAGRSSRDMLRGEPTGLAVHRIRDGSIIWRKEISDGGPYMLHGSTIITDRTAYDMLSGDQKMRIDPLTGEKTPWVFRRDYGCNYAIGSENLLTFRSAAAGFFDLENDGGTGTFGGFRSSCTSNLIAANGVLNAPDYTRTCSCSYQNQTSLALIHMPELEFWTTYYSPSKSVSFVETKTPVLLADARMQLEFGNSAFRELFGFSEDIQLSELTLRNLAEGNPALKEALNGLEKRRNWSGILDLTAPDASPKQVHLMARVLSDEFFQPVAMIFLFGDPTESAVAFVDRHAKLTYVDETFLKLWHFGDEQEALATSFDQLWQEREAVDSMISHHRRGENWTGFLTAVRADGATRDVHVIARPVFDDAGRVISIIINCFDVSERKALEAEASGLVKELGVGFSMKYLMRRRPPVRHLGINFGAPGDRKAEDGTLWLEWPANQGPSPEVDLEMHPQNPAFFNHDAYWVRSRKHNWIVASGVSGVFDFTLRLAEENQSTDLSKGRPYEVRLYFLEPKDLKPGERLFDVTIQGQPALRRFDIMGEAGGSRIAVVKVFTGIPIKETLKVEFTPTEDSPLAEPVICGIQVIAQE